MRVTFARTLASLADRDPRIVLLTGDLGFMALDDYANRHPARFINVGVAEQNMVGIATGLAEAGFVPFIYSIASFAVLRPYEFIKNGPVMHQLKVRIVGVGAGVEYGANGLTHYGFEDIAVTRVQPKMTVLAPADAEQAETILRATWDRPGPIYYRLGKDEKLRVPRLDGAFEWDRVAVLREGTDALLLATSSIAPDAMEVAHELTAAGMKPSVGVVAQIAPPPREHLIELLRRHRIVATIENHYSDGGLGTVIAEIIAEEGIHCRLVRCGIRPPLDGRSGTTAFLHQAYGISPRNIQERVRTALDALS